MTDMYLPTLHWFANKNTFSGSCGNFRYMIKPNVVMATGKEVNFPESSIGCEYWHGPFCYELSTMEDSKVFPLSDEGLAELKQWLLSNI
jgi:hypothetical protein